jgi:hypothetical protein
MNGNPMKIGKPVIAPDLLGVTACIYQFGAGVLL